MKTQCIVEFCVETVSAMLVQYLRQISRTVWRKKNQVGKSSNGGCEQLKAKIKEKDVVTQSIKRKGKIFGSFRGYGNLGFYWKTF